MLKREIRRWDLVLLLVNNTIGAGIFGLPSKIFNLSGFYSLAALLVCAIVIFVLIFIFAEVASRFDKTGGPYLYILTTFGKIPAFIIGWLILITRIAAFAALINLLVTYLSYFYPVLSEPVSKFGVIIGLTFLLTWVNYLGVKNSTKLNNTFAVAKVIPLLIFVIVGLFFINPDLIDIHQTKPSLTDFSSSVLIFTFAFTGFEAIVVNSGEFENAKKNIPFALIVSILFVAIFYGLIQFVSMGTLPELATSTTPITDAAQAFMGNAGAILITIGAVISLTGTLNAVMLVGSRLPYALSIKQQFPKLFSELHHKYQSPVYSLLFFSSISLIASLTGSFIYAVSINVISKVLIFLMVSAAMIKLRRIDTNKVPYFKLPFGYTFSVVGIIASIWLLSSSNLYEVRDVFITIIVGIIILGIYKKVSLNKDK